MSVNGARRSVSMRDGEYIALELYMNHLNEHNKSDLHSRTSLLKMIMFGELPPIPQKYLDIGRKEAVKERKEKVAAALVKRQNQTKKTEEKIEEKIEEESTSYSLGHPPPADDRFDEFWTLYPRKVQKKTAKIAWKNMTKKKREAALAALPAHILHWDDPKFIPHAATWLRAERWEDDLSSSKSATDHERRLLSLSKRYGVSMSAIEQFQKTRGRTPVSRQEIEEMENAT